MIRLSYPTVCAFTACIASQVLACSGEPMMEKSFRELKAKNESSLTESQRTLLSEHSTDYNLVVEALSKTSAFCKNLTQKEWQQKNSGTWLSDSCEPADCDDFTAEQLKKAPYNEGRYRYAAAWEERVDAQNEIFQITHKWMDHR